VDFSVISGDSYILVEVLDSNGKSYGAGNCTVVNGTIGSPLSIPVSITSSISSSATIHLNLYLISQSIYDSTDSATASNSYSSETAIPTELVPCPTSQAQNATKIWFQQNGYYLLGAFLIILIILSLIFFLHKRARARGTSIILMLRKSTIRPEIGPRGVSVDAQASGEMDQLSSKEVAMLQEPYDEYVQPSPPPLPQPPDDDG